jgi:hypothetical protein
MKAKVNLTITPALWQDFRVECVKRQLSASGEVEAFIRGRLSEWGQKGKKGGKERRG